MSPEQIRGKPLDGRADIYSFGARCYELITGRPPFRGNTIPDLLNKHLTEKPVTPQSHNQDITDEFCGPGPEDAGEEEGGPAARTSTRC